jgi:hypothetical protein
MSTFFRMPKVAKSCRTYNFEQYMVIYTKAISTKISGKYEIYDD